MRNCTNHGPQPIDYYYQTRVKNSNGDGFKIQYKCILCKKKYDALKPKRKHNPTAVKKWRQALRLEVLQAYSPKIICSNCGESHIEFLVIDHINGGGRPHVKSVGGFYAWLKREGFPKGFRVLCHNCNFKIGVKIQPSRSIKPTNECSDSYRRNRKRFERHPEKWELNKLKKRTDAKANKIMVLTHYGAKCLCCGTQDIDILSLDHTDGHGNAHRRKIGIRGSGFYRWVIKNNFPDFLRVLCLNCNGARGAYGKCPHEYT